MSMCSERLGGGNRWESPWWRCIWSFRMHATPSCLTWLIKREGARLPILGLSHPVWQMQSPEKAAGPGCICAGYLLRRSVHSFITVFLFFLFPLGIESRFSQQSGGVMTTRTNKSPALQLRIKGQQTPLQKQVLGSAAEPGHFRICLIDHILTGIPRPGKLERGHACLSTRVKRICMEK